MCGIRPHTQIRIQLDTKPTRRVSNTTHSASTSPAHQRHDATTLTPTHHPQCLTTGGSGVQRRYTANPRQVGEDRTTRPEKVRENDDIMADGGKTTDGATKSHTDDNGDGSDSTMPTVTAQPVITLQRCDAEISENRRFATQMREALEASRQEAEQQRNSNNDVKQEENNTELPTTPTRGTQKTPLTLKLTTDDERNTEADVLRCDRANQRRALLEGNLSSGSDRSTASRRSQRRPYKLRSQKRDVNTTTTSAKKLPSFDGTNFRVFKATFMAATEAAGMTECERRLQLVLNIRRGPSRVLTEMNLATATTEDIMQELERHYSSSRTQTTLVESGQRRDGGGENTNDGRVAMSTTTTRDPVMIFVPPPPQPPTCNATSPNCQAGMTAVQHQAFGHGRLAPMARQQGTNNARLEFNVPPELQCDVSRYTFGEWVQIVRENPHMIYYADDHRRSPLLPNDVISSRQSTSTVSRSTSTATTPEQQNPTEQRRAASVQPMLNEDAQRPPPNAASQVGSGTTNRRAPTPVPSSGTAETQAAATTAPTIQQALVDAQARGRRAAQRGDIREIRRAVEGLSRKFNDLMRDAKPKTHINIFNEAPRERRRRSSTDSE